MPDIKNLVIVGGGTAGWMTAAALSKRLGGRVAITLVESEAIGTVGVGEATVPHLRFFNEMLGINEHAFMQATNATYKLGIEFVNWGQTGESYIHPFGLFGASMEEVPFHQYWLKAKQLGLVKDEIEDYAIGAVLARKQKFSYPDTNPANILSKFGYAFHIDANRYASFLREYSEKLGVKRIEGLVRDIPCDETGHVQEVVLEDGNVIQGDFFVDCSGFRALLIEKTLKTGFEDWSHWLVCDRAIAQPTASASDPLPYTKASAQDCGWQWKIPLQHRVGNGLVYSSRFANDEQALELFSQNIDGEALADPNFLRFTSGRRKKTWNKNCVAIGLSSGFLEPLESTSIYLIQIAIMKLVEFFPIDFRDEISANEFNRDIGIEYERIRDFLILHYHVTRRNDSEFWQYCQSMDIPESLSRKLRLFETQGHVEKYKKGMFLEPSWVSVYLGQGCVPHSVHPSLHNIDEDLLSQKLGQLKQHINVSADKLSSHAQFIREQQVNVDESHWPPAAMSLYGVFS